MKLKDNILICNITAAAPVLAGSAATAGTITATQFFATAAAGGTAAAATTAASAFTAFDVISGVVSGLGILSSIQGGNEEAGISDMQAFEEEQNAKLAALDAKTEENNAREKMIKAMAQNIAAAGASNLSLDSGTITRGLEDNAQTGHRQINTAKTRGDIEIQNKVNRATQLRIKSSASKKRGFTDAAFGLMDFARRQKQRGTVPTGVA